MKTSSDPDVTEQPERVARGSLRRMVGRVVLVIAIWAMGHWMGYWYGRTKELYESAKRYGAIPQETTWEQFLKRK